MTIPADARRQVIQRAEFRRMNHPPALAIRLEEANRHHHPPVATFLSWISREVWPARPVTQPSTLNSQLSTTPAPFPPSL